MGSRRFCWSLCGRFRMIYQAFSEKKLLLRILFYLWLVSVTAWAFYRAEILQVLGRYIGG